MLPFLDTGNAIKSHADAATSRGVLVTGSGTAHTKGSYSELVTATEFDSCGLLLRISESSATGREFIDIAVGAAASEIIIAENIAVRGSASTPYIYLPVAIPAGTRISARLQGDSGSLTCRLQVVAIAQAGPQVPFIGSRIQSYGEDLASTDGTFEQLTSYTANTKGGWLQMDAAVADDIFALCLAQIMFTGSNVQLLVDIGIGAAASEVVILENLPFGANGNVQTAYSPWLPVYVPKGERLAIRFQSNLVGSGYYPDFLLYGVH